MRLSVVLLAAVALTVPTLVGIVLRLGPDPVRIAAHQPLVQRDADFIGAAACRSCHPDQHASWSATYHSTMTRTPSATSVVGAFDGRTVELFGGRARPFLRDGKAAFELPTAGGTRVAEVALVVGSRRYQQYFEREPRGTGFALVRIPLLWHIEEKRWLHLNGVFLEPDDMDWGRHRSVWNENCILCHNTGPSPRFTNYAQHPAAADRSFASTTAELGIACEACHGPGREHAAAHAAPLARYATHFASAPDPTIVNPRRLDKQRSVDVCGQCHGQRMPRPLEAISAWLQSGPPFRAGNVLAEHVEPITRATRSPRVERADEFELRFWRDGTPRLSAYEYQGVTASACFVRGELTCLSCHAMHVGDPKGQIRPDRIGNAACTSCHTKIAGDVPAHTRHAANSSGSLCLECHMPRIVYGILATHRSHRIEIPDAARDAEAGRPGACTLCHVDRSPLWAARETARAWKRPLVLPKTRPDGAELELPDAMASLLCGDPLQRAMFAAALGRAEIAVAPRDLAAARVHLVTTLCDAYPSIRHLAERSLLALESRLPLGLASGLAHYDPLAPDEARRASAFELFEALAKGGRGVLAAPPAASLVGSDLRPDLPRIIQLLDRQSRQGISIGE